MSHLGVFCTWWWYISYVQLVVQCTIRSDTHNQREFLRRAIGVQLVHDWQLQTNVKVHVWKTKFEEYIFMHARMNRDLCLDLGLRKTSHYFHYRIIIKCFYYILLAYCYIAAHKWEDFCQCIICLYFKINIRNRKWAPVSILYLSLYLLSIWGGQNYFFYFHFLCLI